MMGAIPPVAAGITQVQKQTYGSVGNSTTHNIVLPGTPTTGNLLILCIVADTVISATIPSNGGSTTFSQVANAVDNTGTYMYVKTVSATDSATTVVTLSSSASCSLIVYEYNGITALDKQTSAIGQGGSGTVNPGTTAATTAANELVIALAGLWLNGLAQDVSAWSNGFAVADSVASTFGVTNRAATGIKIVSVTGTQNSIATLTATLSANNSGIIATFK